MRKGATSGVRLFLFSTTALAIILCMDTRTAKAQSVEVDAVQNNVNPYPSSNPQPIWSNILSLYVGFSDMGKLTIEDGGIVESRSGILGLNPGSVGTVIVSGNGSRWTNSQVLGVGEYGKGEMDIIDGGIVESTHGHIGDETGSVGTVTVSGTGSMWKNSGDLLVGVKGRGTLTIEDGGAVENIIGSIGYDSSSVGGVTVSGVGSTWKNSSDLYVGRSGSGTLTIEDGGTVENTNGSVSRGSGSEGAVAVSGAGSTWRNSSFLYVGHDELGTVYVEDGGVVETANTYIGYGIGSEGVVTLTAAGSTWKSRNKLMVGFAGKGALDIADGGRAENVIGSIGYSSKSEGAVTVFGAGSTWTNSGNLIVGAYGKGTLTVKDGGAVENLRGIIGEMPHSEGAVTVSGAGSTWKSNDVLDIGSQSKGTLIIENGGNVETHASVLGNNHFSEGSVTVSGAGSTLKNHNTLSVGNYGAGTLTVSDGGTVSANNGSGTVYLGMKLWNGNRSKGVLNIGGALGSQAEAAGILLAGDLIFEDGDGTLNFNHDGATTFSLDMESAGSGTHTVNHAAGTTMLTGDSSAFTGTTTVSGGTLLIGDAAGNGTLGGVVNVGMNGALGGSGTLNGAVTIDGTLAAGNSAGTLTFSSDLTLNAGSTSVFELNSPGVAGGAGNDLVRVNGALALDGTLDARVAAAGYYRLFEYGGAQSGAFADGTVTGTGGFAAADPNNPDIRYDIPGQVNLSVLGTGQTMQFWDGAGTAANGAVDGGSGVWQSFATNWTDATGSANTGWSGSVGVFAGAAGTVTVQGAQVFDTLQFSTDDYRIQGDALSIGAAGGGTFNIDGGVTTTVASIIEDGAGKVVRKAGGGTLVLSGANTHSGGVDLLGGVLSVASDQHLGAAPGGLRFDGGVLKVTGTGYTGTARDILIGGDGGGFDIADADNTFSLSQDITGTGDLLKRGDGTLVLGGTNGYRDTLVEAGTLAGNAGSISGDIGNGATVVFDQAGDASFSGNIGSLNGTEGAMIKRGAGVLTLSGASTLDWSVDAGGLVTDASRFAGDVDIASGASLNFDQNTATNYAGVLSGAGGFSVSGSGTVTLIGDSSGFTGTTSFSNGSLIVGTAAGGALGGSIMIGQDSLLGGTGTIGSAGSTVMITAGGTHAPGNSIGVQTIAGNYTNHGTLAVEMTPTAADKVIVQGAVDIAGATLALTGTPLTAADWPILNGPYTIIDNQGTGAVNGTFASVTNNLLFLDETIDYAGGDGNDITLDLNRNDTSFADVGVTPNQRETAAAANSLPTSNAIWQNLVTMTDEEMVRASLDSLSGEVHPSFQGTLNRSSAFLRDAANDRVRAAFAASEETHQDLSHGITFWSEAYGAWADFDSDGNAAAMDLSAGGMFVGADALAGNWRFGLLGGYGQSKLDVAKVASSAESKDYHLGIYAGTELGKLGIRTGAGYSWHSIDTARNVHAGAFTDSLTASYHASTFQAFGEVSYSIDLPSARLEPFINLAYAHQRSDGFMEQGGAAALTVSGQSMDTGYATIGARMEHEFQINTVKAKAKAMLGWQTAFGDTNPKSLHSFGGGSDFANVGMPIARNASVIEAGVDFDLTPRSTLGFSYRGQIAENARQHGINGMLSIRF